MRDDLGQAPKFPGELSDHLPPARGPDRPDTWTDRLRHAWLVYALLAVGVPAWIGLMIAAVVYFGPFGWLVAFSIATAPVAVYIRLMQWRLVTGRDLDTGERLGRREP